MRDAVKHKRYHWGDLYSGSRTALIEAGVAAKGWFPAKPVLDNRGRKQRSFDIGDTGHIRIHQHDGARDHWSVCVSKPVSPKSAPIRPEPQATGNESHAGLAAAKKLEPIRQQLDGCAGLLKCVIDDVQDKVVRVKTAHRVYGLPWTPKAADPEERRAEIIASAEGFGDSSKLSRAVDDLKMLRTNLRDVIAEIEGLIASGT